MIKQLKLNKFQVHPIVYGGPVWLSLESVKGLGTPGPRNETFDRPRAHGLVNRTQFYPGRVIELSGRVLAANGATDDDVVRAIDDIKAAVALLGDNDIKVLFRRRGLAVDEFVMARVSSPFEVDYVPRDHLKIFWGLQLLAADPRMFSDVLKTGTLSPTGALFGVTFPLVFPLVFGEAATGLMVKNDGNFPTPPILTVRGPATNPIVDNVTTGKSIALTGTIAGSDSVVINVTSRVVSLNGVERADLLNVAGTTWWEIERGIQQLRLRGTGFSGGDTRLTVEFRDARI